jgi:hypothetical protein
VLGHFFIFCFRRTVTTQQRLHSQPNHSRYSVSYSIYINVSAATTNLQERNSVPIQPGIFPGGLLCYLLADVGCSGWSMAPTVRHGPCVSIYSLTNPSLAARCFCNIYHHVVVCCST